MGLAPAAHRKCVNVTVPTLEVGRLEPTSSADKLIWLVLATLRDKTNQLGLKTCLEYTGDPGLNHSQTPLVCG